MIQQADCLKTHLVFFSVWACFYMHFVLHGVSGVNVALTMGGLLCVRVRGKRCMLFEVKCL